MSVTERRTIRKKSAGGIGPALRQCPVCGSPQLEYKFVVDGAAMCGCEACGLLFLNPQPVGPPECDRPLAESAGADDVAASNARERIEQLVRYANLQHGLLLLVGADRDTIVEAEARGLSVVAYSAADFEAASSDALPAQVDACLLFRALEKMADPVGCLTTIRGLLVESGALMVVAPAIDSPAAHLFGGSWWEFNRANRFYFSVNTLQNILTRAGFGNPLVFRDRSRVSLNYLERQFAAAPRAPRLVRAIRRILSVSPLPHDATFRVLSGRTTFLVSAQPLHTSPRLSVIVPVYNEAATCGELLDQLLAKTIDGIDIEVIIIESSSSDGSRDAVLRHRDHPRVRLILEERPMGKGHAVREGLKAASGDIVLIQDADLEYDLNDYEALIGPIARYEQNFILGSRHTVSGWKIRQFSDAPGLSTFFNFGHILFLALFNLLYGQRLSDPFTMFKVFRRGCIFGLEFECNRFDFDHELVIKLLQKGYQPLELPVNYVSRSLSEGKKVTVFRDPLTWIRALIRFRLHRLHQWGRADEKPLPAPARNASRPGHGSVA